MLRSSLYALCASALALAVACEPGNGFDSFSLVNKLRILGVRSEPPSLAPGEQAELSALVIEPDGEPINYRWSWCPLVAGRDRGFECAIEEAQLRELLAGVSADAADALPPYDLGSGPEASYPYSLSPALLAAACEGLIRSEAPAFVELATCQEQLTVSVRLEVESGGQRVAAVKELALYFDAADSTNNNPTLGPISFVSRGAPREAAKPLTGGEPATLSYGAAYSLFVDVPEAATETFVRKATPGLPEAADKRETLFINWFASAGSADDDRTTFLEGTTTLLELGENAWSAPETYEADVPDIRFWFVLQDERGGAAWAERAATLGQE